MRTINNLGWVKTSLTLTVLLINLMPFLAFKRKGVMFLFLVALDVCRQFGHWTTCVYLNLDLYLQLQSKLLMHSY